MPYGMLIWSVLGNKGASRLENVMNKFWLTMRLHYGLEWLRVATAWEAFQTERHNGRYVCAGEVYGMKGAVESCMAIMSYEALEG